MSIPLLYVFQNLDVSGLADALDSDGDVLGKGVPVSYIDANFDQLAHVVVVGSNAPVPRYVGQIWLDTGFSPNVLKIWNGNGWVNAGFVDNADKVDGYHANVTPGANLVVVSGNDGKINKDWVPTVDNADKVDGYHASQLFAVSFFFGGE